MVLQAAGTVTTNLVCIHKSCIVYFEISVVPIVMDFHILAMEKSGESHGKSMLEKWGHPVIQQVSYVTRVL